MRTRPIAVLLSLALLLAGLMVTTRADAPGTPHQVRLPLVALAYPTVPPTPTTAPRPTTTAVPTQPPFAGVNVECRPYAGNVEMCAWVTNATPPQYSNVSVYGRLTVAGQAVMGAAMHTVWHFKTVTREEDCVTGGDGIGRCAHYISRATAGYRVWVDVSIVHAGVAYAARTWCTPQ